VALAAITVSIGILAEPLYVVALEAGEQLMNPQAYIDAVLEASR
jgi:multicomponent Na+:H+ antiporter subunit D